LKLSPVNNTHRVRSFSTLIICLSLALILTGCGQKQWADPLLDQALLETASQLDQLTDNQKECPQTMSANMALYYNSPLQQIAQDGTLHFSQPSSFKFVITNPLGLPVWAVAGDHKNYQILNTMSTQFVRGTVKAFGIRNKIPEYLIKGVWGDWLTGRNSFLSDDVLSIEPDVENRGVWIKVGAGDKHELRSLVNLQTGVIAERIVFSKSGRKVARIAYSDHQEAGSCLQPGRILVTGLDYGTEIRLDFSDIQLSTKTKNYSLKPPPHYFKKLMP